MARFSFKRLLTLSLVLGMMVLLGNRSSMVIAQSNCLPLCIANGNVGISTTNSQAKLHTDGNVTAFGPSLVGSEFVIPLSDRGDGGRAIMHDNGDVLRINYNGEMGGGTSIGTGVAVHGEIHITGPDFEFLPTDRGNGGRAIVHDFNDTLVINYGDGVWENGDFSGGVRIDSGTVVMGNIHMLGPDLKMLPTTDRGDGGRVFVHDFNDVLHINYGGEFTGGTTIGGSVTINGSVSALSQRVYGPSDVDALLVHGDASVRSLQIRGGADIAEPFDMTDHAKIEPGMVVAIDPDHPGQLRLAKTAYDRTVAGVVSGAGGVDSGLIMQQEGSVADGEHPVALTGRVYAWVDATKTPVNPGDMLTTSNTPGHAMKVADYQQAQGAILGKAMSKLATGKGLVLVLVTLQ